MSGMDRNSGKRLDGDAHIAQSIADILTTPQGARVMRRDYGSRLFELIDQPMNAGLRLLMAAATAQALARWEPRLKLQRVQIGGESATGTLTVNLTGIRTDIPRGAPVAISIPV